GRFQASVRRLSLVQINAAQNVMSTIRRSQALVLFAQRGELAHVSIDHKFIPGEPLLERFFGHAADYTTLDGFRFSRNAKACAALSSTGAAGSGPLPPFSLLDESSRSPAKLPDLLGVNTPDRVYFCRFETS